MVEENPRRILAALPSVLKSTWRVAGDLTRGQMRALTYKMRRRGEEGCHGRDEKLRKALRSWAEGGLPSNCFTHDMTLHVGGRWNNRKIAKVVAPPKSNANPHMSN